MDKIKEIVNIKPFEQVIDFQVDNKELFNNYIILEETADYFTQILEGLSRYRDQDTAARLGALPQNIHRCHKITGTYGVGKSYFLLMLKAILESLNNVDKYTLVKDKFSSFISVTTQLEELKNKGKRYIIVNINGKSFGDLPLKNVIENQVYRTLAEIIGINNLNFAGFYRDASELLINWKQQGNPIAKDFNKYLKNKSGLDYEELITALKRREQAAKEIFEQCYEAIIMAKFGMQGYEKLEEFLEQCDENVKNNGYTGIVILFDELSAYLRSRAEAGALSKELSTLDILAEKTLPSSLLELHLITTEHEDIEKILSKDIDNSPSVKRTVGRFINHQLVFEKGSQLIAGVLDKNNPEFKRFYQENLSLFDSLIAKSNVDFIDTYPMNPYATRYLLKISEKYAQMDRTVFMFIDQELRTFVQNGLFKAKGMLNLLGPEVVLDFFKQTISSEREEVVRAFNEQTKRCDTELKRKLIKLLTLEYAVSSSSMGASTSSLKIDDIKYALMVTEEDFAELKAYLQQETNDAQSYIVYNSGLNTYELSVDSAGINLDRELENELSNCNENEFLKNLILKRSSVLEMRTSYIVPKEGNKFPFDRVFEGRLIRQAGDLEKLNTEFTKTVKTDGVIVYYVPPAGKAYDFKTICKLAEQKVDEIDDIRVAIAVPKDNIFSDIQSKQLLNQLQAAERLTSNERITSNQRASNSLRLMLADLRAKVNTKLSSFSRADNFTFYFKDEVLANITGIENLLDYWLSNKLYTKFPTIPVEDFSSRNASNLIINRLVIPTTVEIENINGSDVLSKQIRWALLPLDLVSQLQIYGGYRITLKTSNKESVNEIFHILEDPNFTMKEKYKVLTKTPYGLNDPMIEVLFAIFLKISEKYYLTDKDGRRLEVTVNNIKDFWDQNYKLCETSDMVSRTVKQDVINIFQIMDNCFFNNKMYQRLSSSMPSDDFNQVDKLDAIHNYCEGTAAKIEVFISKLNAIKQNDITILTSKIEDVEYSLRKIKDMYRPHEFLKGISRIVDDYFDNGMAVGEDNENISPVRYQKLQNFFDNIIWLSNEQVKLEKCKTRVDQITNSTFNIDLEAVIKAVNTLKETNTLIYNNIFSMDNWKQNKYADVIDLDIWNKQIDECYDLYNERYKIVHKLLHSKVNELQETILNYEYNPLIFALEKIKFDDLARWEDIKRQSEQIHLCQNHSDGNSGKLAYCKMCGNYIEIKNKTKQVKEQQQHLYKILGSLVDKYIEKLVELNSAETVSIIYKRNMKLIEFTGDEYPEKLDNVITLYSLLQPSWEDNVEEIQLRIKELVPVINDFINPVEPAPPLRKIGFNEVLNNLGTQIKYSGYSEMNFKILKTEVQKYLNKLEVEYDIVDI